MSIHGDMRRDEEVEGSSNRSFGLVFAVVFLVIACWPDDQGHFPWAWAGGFSIIFLGSALMAPEMLAPLNRVWTKIGFLMHKVVSPVILGIMFFGVLLPTGLLKRVFGTDGMGLTFDKKAESYWVERDPPGPAPDSMKQQF